MHACPLSHVQLFAIPWTKEIRIYDGGKKQTTVSSISGPGKTGKLHVKE